PSPLTITSCDITGAECGFAQLGSEAILIGFGAGTLPSNRTFPRTVEPVVVGAGPPARTPYGTDRHNATSHKLKNITFGFIPSTSTHAIIFSIVVLLRRARRCSAVRTRSGP